MNEPLSVAGAPAVGCSALLGVMVKIITLPFCSTGFGLRWVWDSAKLALEQSARCLLYIPSPNLSVTTLSLATPNSFQRHMPRKKSPAWSCGDTFLFFRQGCNHPESGGDASKPRSTAAPHRPTGSEPTGASCASEKTEASQRGREWRSQIMPILLGYTILAYLSVRDLAPTWGPLEWLLTSMLVGLLLSLLDNLSESHGTNFSCDARMTPNGLS